MQKKNNQNKQDMWFLKEEFDFLEQTSVVLGGFATWHWH